jgi:tungstate transport system substrate-binding protein
MNRFTKLIIIIAILCFPSLVRADELRLAVTTSFYNSGLSEILLPPIKQDLGFDIQLLVVGTGQALRLGKAGDVDAVLVHSKAAELAFVQSGYGTHRREIMYNDFVIVGPNSDPANIQMLTDVTASFAAIRDSKSLFVSRGDDSGTHKKELGLWQGAGQDAIRFSPDWYRAIGASMGAALNVASGMNAYLLTDRASWINFGNKGDLRILFEGDHRLFNQYAYLPVSQKRHPHVKSELAAKLEAWLTGETGQSLIANYKLGGEQLFVPNAKPVQ